MLGAARISLRFFHHTVLLCTLTALSATAEMPSFREKSPEGAFHFDTGVLRGTLREGGHSLGVRPLQYGPHEVALLSAPGLYNHYRVFTANRRHGESMRALPSTAERVNPSTVRIRWEAGEENPFILTATYRWTAPDTLDLITEVTAMEDLPGFEVFLASYCAETFPVASVYVQHPDGGPGFMTAERMGTVWQMFPRDAAAVSLIQGGRWAMLPSPVDWAIRPRFAAPLAYRRDPARRVTVVTMARTEDCFAVSAPERGEAHYSMYFSLFGNDVATGETVRARTRLAVGVFDDGEILARYAAFLKSFEQE